MISYSIAASNYTKKHDEPYSILKDLKINNLNRIVCAHLNTNSIRNKFEPLVSYKKYLDRKLLDIKSEAEAIAVKTQEFKRIPASYHSSCIKQ